jgi:hypothetical protein
MRNIRQISRRAQIFPADSFIWAKINALQVDLTYAPRLGSPGMDCRKKPGREL